MELADQFADVSGEYARLLLLLDMAREKAVMLGETKIADEVHGGVHVVSARLVELSNEIDARRLLSGE